MVMVNLRKFTIKLNLNCNCLLREFTKIICEKREKDLRGLTSLAYNATYMEDTHLSKNNEYENDYEDSNEEPQELMKHSINKESFERKDNSLIENTVECPKLKKRW